MRFWIEDMQCNGGKRFTGLLEAHSAVELWIQLRAISGDNSMWMREVEGSDTAFMLKSVAWAGPKGHARRLYDEDATVIDMASYRDMLKRSRRDEVSASR